MKKSFRIRVVAPHDCFISDVEGDPGRSRLSQNAKLFTLSNAQKECYDLKKQYHHRNFVVEPCD